VPTGRKEATMTRKKMPQTIEECNAEMELTQQKIRQYENRNKIYKLKEMDADHATAWSNGGATDISNCTMLCSTHNRAKGNK
jgi:5-methylcytosine-specific restriction endonuclease McrA